MRLVSVNIRSPGTTLAAALEGPPDMNLGVGRADAVDSPQVRFLQL